MRTVEEHARVTSPTLRRFAGAIRRMAITVTAKALWQVIGHRTLEGTDETAFAEVFSGVGFYARPPRNGKPEAIVVHVGGAKHPVVVGTRDEKTRAAVASIGEDEAIVFSSGAVVHVRSNGIVEVRKPGGQAVALATKADVEALRDYVAGIKLPVDTNTGTAGPPVTPPSSPAGTTVLRAQ